MRKGCPSARRTRTLSPFTSRRRQQTAPQGASSSEWVLITFPVHPLRGMRLAVMRAVRSQGGQQYVDVQHPRGGFIRLPLEWTDRRTPTVPTVSGGRQVRLSAPALLKLAEAVEEGLKRPLPPAPAALPEQESRFNHASTAAAPRRPVLVAPVRGSQKSAGERVGQPAAQGAARRGGRRRAKP